jgi:hypothetical protein
MGEYGRRQSHNESNVEQHCINDYRRIDLIRKPVHLISPNTRLERGKKDRRNAVNASLRALVQSARSRFR